MKRLLVTLAILIPFLGFSQDPNNWIIGKTIERTETYQSVVRDSSAAIGKENLIQSMYMQEISADRMDSVKFMYFGAGGTLIEDDGIYDKVSQVLDMSDFENHGTQTVTANKPYVAGNVAPSTNEGINNPPGDTRTIDITTPITVSGTYTITKCYNNDSIGKTLVTHTELTSGTISEITFTGTMYAYIIHAEALTDDQKAAENAFLTSVFPEIPSVTIGTQTWSVENFNGFVSNGFVIPNITDATEWASSQTIYDDSLAAGYSVYECLQFASMWCYYSNSTEIGSVFGKHYNWFAVLLIQQDIDLYNAVNDEDWGWHIPTSNEFETLQTYLGGSTVAGGKMKLEGTDYWNSPNTGATNSSCFSAIGGGVRTDLGSYVALKATSNFWSILEYSNTTAYQYFLSPTSSTLGEAFISKKYGFNLRLIKD